MKVGIMLSNQQLASTDMVSALEEHPKRPMASFDAMVTNVRDNAHND